MWYSACSGHQTIQAINLCARLFLGLGHRKKQNGLKNSCPLGVDSRGGNRQYLTWGKNTSLPCSPQGTPLPTPHHLPALTSSICSPPPLLTPVHLCQPPHCSLQTSGTVQPQGLCTGCSPFLEYCSQGWLLILQNSKRPSLTILPKFIFISVPDYLL